MQGENHPGYASVKDVVAHIDHVVKLVGIDYVGIGSIWVQDISDVR